MKNQLIVLQQTKMKVPKNVKKSREQIKYLQIGTEFSKNAFISYKIILLFFNSQRKGYSFQL
jgi:hypothetical protein